MILQALDAYYRRKQADPDPAKRLPAFGLEDKEIPFVLEIDADGCLLNVADTRSGDGKKKIGQRFLVPQGVKKTSGVAANLLWDNAEYVLGIPDAKKLEKSRAENKEADYLDRLRAMRQKFRDAITTLPDTVQTDTGIRAVLAFLDTLTPETLAGFAALANIEAANPILSFRLHGDIGLVCQRPAVVAATATQSEARPDGVCLVSGVPAVIERLHAPIKGVWDKPGATVNKNIVSVNNKSDGQSNGGQTPAFASYGKQQGYSSPVGKPAVFAYTTALNHLLARNSRQRTQVGDTSTVFWAEETHELEDLFGEIMRDDPARNIGAVKALYSAIDSGKFTVGKLDTRFHVLGLAPNSARISIRFWETATAAELARRIKRHFDDIEVVHADYEPEHLSLSALLKACSRKKSDGTYDIPPNLGGEVMRAILEELPYPITMLNLAVGRCRAEQARKDQNGRPLPNVSYARAAAIKASLNRFIRQRNTSDKEFLPMLDPDNTSPAYRLGRLFATLERIQEDAAGGSGKLNATIRDRYYGAASSTPSAVFPTLLRLQKHHLGKLATGLAVTRERLVQEIMDGFDPATFPPPILTLPDQARFALGYYQQRQAFFVKAKSKNQEEKL
ncbi:type I-C CRISPR-associated protein Cas8c/Csd1 [Acidithiobacillus sulfuriphilus]|uniref:Type I-C CRISPR-associated protein Cas8c/Csd1 n=2 Tax=Acidithiobacillus sulfuriphilus TaxID=1867749 RepID=A0A3M8QZD4_9PROT|nr:type I-C CRISPR-associated protein Cas8c/Csd1 [Acidithiobacillus sulfuriphilus]RNF61688.1 type I-C CRISPR-associated protein Cas8c/Csd1 [Acidithiobacillus sulfuriphilus]